MLAAPYFQQEVQVGYFPTKIVSPQFLSVAFPPMFLPMLVWEHLWAHGTPKFRLGGKVRSNVHCRSQTFTWVYSGIFVFEKALNTLESFGKTLPTNGNPRPEFSGDCAHIQREDKLKFKMISPNNCKYTFWSHADVSLKPRPIAASTITVHLFVVCVVSEVLRKSLPIVA